MIKWDIIAEEKETTKWKTREKHPGRKDGKLSAKMDSLRNFPCTQAHNNSNTLIYILGSFEDLKMLRNEEKCWGWTPFYSVVQHLHNLHIP